jgi:serine/threonine protein kinase/tetratricopeptide (TPR) repeat protein
MTPERWRQIEELFQAAAERAPELRAAFLDQACADDHALRREVESLLSHEVEETFIHAAIAGTVRSLPAEAEELTVGRRIGAYQVTGLIGEGGMGVVYRAVRADDQYQQQVALKLVKRGMATDFVLSRFRHERQILASLAHPHIARLLDGGTTEEGLPYFVMEHIEGEPITRYCETHELALPDRLRLFREVCAAVQYAHQQLVVHRDLKPSNILINREGVPKLLDFGIAKLLDPELVPGAVTQAATAVGLMTPEYASPEQVRGLAITTASDIYSLGVVLYEVLTGSRPHQRRDQSIGELERAICETEPEKPSLVVKRGRAAGGRLSRQLAGDLDNIVLTALRKEPERRYASVEQLSEDIGRHQGGRPVIARRDTAGYRARKFIGRHRAGVAAAALVVLSLIGGLAATSYQARRAGRRFGQVRKLANTFLFDIHDKIQNLPGSTEARELVVKTALGYLDSLAREAGDDVALQQELAMAYIKVGDVQGNPFASNLGQPAAALESYRKALDLAQRPAAAEARDVRSLSTLANAHYKVGDLEAYTGETARAIEDFRKGLGVAARVNAHEPGNPDNYRLLTGGYNRLGDAQLRQGEVTSALESYREGLKVAGQWEAGQPGERSRLALATGSVRVGHVMLRQGDPAGALESYRRAQKVREELVGQQPNNITYRRDLGVLYQSMAQAFGGEGRINLGDRAQALAHERKALGLFEELAAADPKSAQARSDLSIAYSRVAILHHELDPAQSVELHRKALALNRALLESAPGSMEYRRNQALYNHWIGYSLVSLRDWEGALRHLGEARESLQELATADPARRQFRQDLWQVNGTLGDALLGKGDWAGAREHYEKALSMGETLVAANPADESFRLQLAEDYEDLGKLNATLAARPGLSRAERRARWQEARDWYRRSLEVWDDWGRRAPSGPLPYDTKKRDQAAREFARCESALARLESRK